MNLHDRFVHDSQLRIMTIEILLCRGDDLLKQHIFSVAMLDNFRNKYVDWRSDLIRFEAQHPQYNIADSLPEFEPAQGVTTSDLKDYIAEQKKALEGILDRIRGCL